jgi:hypothetical protein
MPKQEWTGSGALAITFEVGPETGVKLQSARLHLNDDSALDENYTVDVDSADGSMYDVRLMVHSMQDTKDIVCDFKEERLHKNDKLAFAWANTDGKEWGLELIWDNFC